MIIRYKEREIKDHKLDGCDYCNRGWKTKEIVYDIGKTAEDYEIDVQSTICKECFEKL